MSRLRRLTIDELTPHPQVQLEHTFSEGWVKRMVPRFDESALGVLTVCDAPKNGKHYIIDGRHRHALVTRVGHPNELRCDDHGKLSDTQAARLKLAIDRDRRRVSPLEHYEQRLLAGDSTVVAIDKIVKGAGWRINQSGNDTSIRGVAVIERLYCGDNGPVRLRRTLTLATHWRGERRANGIDWIAGLSIFVKDGLDELLTPQAWDRLDDVVPAQLIRKAQGRVDVARSGDRLGAQLSYEIAEGLRKAAGIRRPREKKARKNG